MELRGLEEVWGLDRILASFGFEWGAEGEDIAVGVGEDKVAEAVVLVGGVGEDGGSALAEEGTIVVDFFGEDDDRAAAEGALPEGVLAEMQVYLAEGYTGVVVVAEVFGEAEDVAVEGEGGGDVRYLEDGGGAGGLHGGSIWRVAKVLGAMEESNLVVALRFSPISHPTEQVRSAGTPGPSAEWWVSATLVYWHG